MSEDTLASVAWSTNTAWSHDVDKVLGTHSLGGQGCADPAARAGVGAVPDQERGPRMHQLRHSAAAYSATSRPRSS